MQQGLIHIYCGDGKGKTSAAIGQAVRAAGRGMEVTIARFLKNQDSGEICFLQGLPHICLLSCGRDFGFTWNMTEEQKKEAQEAYTQLLEEAFDRASSSKEGGLLVLDEASGAAAMGFIPLKRLLERLDRRPENLEVVITGRGPAQELLDRADYITRMEAVRHPYEKGITARIGIEY